MGIAAAVLCSLIAPGAGHILTGNYVQGVVLGSLFALGKTALLPLALRVFRVSNMRRTLQFFYACNWCYIALILYAVCSSIWFGFEASNLHVVQALLFACMVILVYKRTQNKFIFASLCGREGVWELMQKMRGSSSEKIKK